MAMVGLAEEMGCPHACCLLVGLEGAWALTGTHGVSMWKKTLKP